MTKYRIILAFAVFLGGGSLILWNIRSKDVRAAAAKEEVRPPRVNAITKSHPDLTKWKSLTNDELPQYVRIEISQTIDADLQPGEIDFLLKALTHTPSEHDKEQWWVILNEIMEQMRKKGVAPNHFGLAMTDLVKDPLQSEVVRDYAVQHLSQWIAPTNDDTAGETSHDVIANALIAIAATISDPSISHTSIPGTSLMALTASSENLPEEVTNPVWERLDPTLTGILKGEIQGSLSTRTTIIQVFALRNNERHLPLIQQFARDSEVNTSLRLSSIAALGIYRSKTDREYLQEIAAGNTRYRFAAHSALKKLTNK